MANELKINASIVAEKGTFKYQFAPGQLQVDLANGGRHGHAQSIGTIPEAIDLGDDVTTEGYCVLRNTDATNFVTYGPLTGTSTMVDFGRLKAGEFAILRIEPGITIWAQADTAAVILDVVVLED